MSTPVSPFFPEKLKALFSESAVQKLSVQRIKEVAVDKTTQEGFKEWSTSHAEFVRRSPALKSLEKSFMELESQPSNPDSINSISNVFKDFENKKFKHVSPDILKSHSDFEDLICSVEIGLLSYKETIPFLLNIPQKIRIRLLSIQDENGLIPFEKLDYLKEAIPIIEQFSDEEIVEILELKDGEGLTLLHYPDTFKEAIPLLLNLPWKSRLRLLSIHDKDVDPPLFYLNVFKEAIPIIIDKFLSIEMVELFKLKDIEGHGLLHYEEICHIAVPFLIKLPQQQQIRLLSIANYLGYSPLHYIETFKELMPVIKNLSNERKVKLMEITDYRGRSAAVELILSYKEAIPLLKQVDFMTEDAEEECYRIYLANIWGLQEHSVSSTAKSGVKSRPIELFGISPKTAENLMKEQLQLFFQKSNIFDTDVQNQILESFSTTTDDQDILNMINSNKPVIILGGTDAHGVGILIWKNKLIVCNRGTGSKKRPKNCEIFSLSKENISIELIQSLKKEYDNMSSLYQMIDKLYLDREGGFSLKHQGSENCSWANLKATIAAFYNLHFSDEIIARNIYKQFTTFTRLDSLEKYLDKYSTIDHYLVKEILMRIENSNRFDFLKKKSNDLENIIDPDYLLKLRKMVEHKTKIDLSKFHF